MKLIRLKINSDFRSLPAGFELNFLRDSKGEDNFRFHPYCLVGPNGSGKSNVLEALAAIFYHIECIYLNYRPDGFEFDPTTNPEGFQAEKAVLDSFELEYLFSDSTLLPINRSQKINKTPAAHIHIIKKLGQRPIIYWLNREEFEEYGQIELSRSEVKGFLPRYILGYSSGHNEILSLPFFKMRFIHYDEYRHRLVKGLDYDGRPEGRMIYLDDQFSQTILLCHFLFPSDAVTKIFEDKIGLKGIRRFRLIIRRQYYLDLLQEDLELMDSDEKKNQDRARVELTSKLSGYYNENNELQLGLIDKLIKCSTTHYEDSFTEQGEGSNLVLDYWINDETRRAFQFHFGASVGGSEEKSLAASALNLFQSFQTLLTLNYCQVDEGIKSELYRSDSLYLNETIPLPASHERIMRFKDFEIIKSGTSTTIYGKALSDGEHQLAHTIGLCLLFRYEPALFLLDEPETHLNPEWRASYISTLRSALEADTAAKQVIQEVLITSHSPFIISDCERSNVIVFKKDSSGRAEWSNPDFNTFGASANAITIKIFNRKETIGNYSLSKLEALQQRLEEGESPGTLINEASTELGDSIEKVLFINRALDIEQNS